MADNTSGIVPAIVLSAIVATLSIVGTLLVHNQKAIETKADKTDATDRWTGTMQAIQQRCDTEKEGLRQQREELRDEASKNALHALDWKSQALACQGWKELHMRTCKCNHEVMK